MSCPEGFTPSAARFVRYGMDEGLSGIDIRCIAQDKRGFIWFGTTVGGLNRFDGYDMKTYPHSPEDPHSLSHNYVWCLLADSKGRLWAGTAGGGLNRLDTATERFIRHLSDPAKPDTLSNNAILSLLEGDDGTLWVGTRGGLNALDPETGKVVRHPVVIQGSPLQNMQSVRCIVADPHAPVLWLGTSDGLFCFDPASGSYQGYARPDINTSGIGYNSINSIVPDGDGALWLATEHGVCRFVPPSRKVRPGTNAMHISEWEVFLNQHAPGGLLGANAIRTMLEDDAGGLWLGASSGVSRFDRRTRRFENVPDTPGDPESMTSTMINRLFVDRQGGLWVATAYGGAYRMRPPEKMFRNYRVNVSDPSAGLSDQLVTCVHPDSRGRLWVGTFRGLNLLENGRWKRFLHDPEDPTTVSGNHISAIGEDGQGNIWVGTPNQGLNKWDNGQFRRFINPSPSTSPRQGRMPYASSQIGSFYLDRKGRLWINGRSYGLDCLENEGFTHWAPYDEKGERLPISNLIPGYLDDDEGLWCASELCGLVRFHIPTGKTEQFFPGSTQAGNTSVINTFAVTHDGANGLWVPSISGLHHFDLITRRFDRALYAKDGLPADAIISVQRDQVGQLWLGTNSGLVRLDPDTGHCRVYQTADGLPSNQLLLFSSACDREGRLFFGSTAGLTSFLPSELRDNPTPPSAVVLSGFRLFNKEISPRTPDSPLPAAIEQLRSITLGPDQRAFGLRFSAMDFNAPTRALYSYKLEGYDTEWITGHKREVDYMNLPAGNYRFLIRGANADNVWNTTARELAITIQPAWFQTALFRWSVGLATLCSSLGLVVWRMRSLRLQASRLALLVEERTRELREAQTGLEERVRQRTSELAHSNEQLRAEIAERERIATDLEKSREHLRQSQKMEAFGQLAGGVAHDFNNILTVILGQAQCATDPTASSEERQEALTDIQEAAQRAVHLTRQLLVFSRKQAVEIRDLDLARLVTDHARMLRRIIGEDIALRIDQTSGSLASRGDPAMLEQVLLNLGINARDAMPQGGELHISFSGLVVDQAGDPLHPLCPAPGAYHVIHVRDTGCGMSPETLSRLFEPFFTTKPVGRGTGLGLATSLSIIRQHAGWMEVDSTPGAGTTFRIHLPASGNAAGQSGQSDKPDIESLDQRPPNGKTILLVEDEAGVRKSTRRMLLRQGYDVIEAENGDHALAQWSTHRDRIDLLLTDIVMPGSLNGHTLSHRLLADKPSLKVILMSGYDPTQLAGKAFHEGQQPPPVLVKPFAIRDLLGTLEERLLK